MKFHLKKDETKKNQILEATFTCIYEHGARAVTMRSIAGTANVSQGLLHYYFKNKQNLFTEFFQILFDRVVRNLENSLKPADSATKKLEGFFKDGQDFVEKHTELMLVGLEIWAMSIRDTKLKRVFADYLKSMQGILKGILEQGEREKTFNLVGKDSDALFILYHAFIIGMGVFHHVNRSHHARAFQIITESLNRIILREFESKKIKTKRS